MTDKRYEIWASDAASMISSTTGGAAEWKLIATRESYAGAVSRFVEISGGYVAAVIEEWDVDRNVFLRMVYDKRGEIAHDCA